MVEKKQTMRYSDDELGLIKNTFAENDNILKALRRFFLQQNLREQDDIELLVFKGNIQLMDVMRKTFLPELTDDTPLGQNIDLLMTLKIDDKTPEEALPHIKARQQMIDYVDERLKVLNGEDIGEGFTFTALTTGNNADDLYINLTSRNTIIGHTEQMLNQLNILAGTKDETPEQTVERLQKNSNK